MKKIFKNTVSRIILLITFTIISMQSWASSGESTDTLDYSQIVSRPDFWVGVVVFIGFITAALMLGKEKKEA